VEISLNILTQRFAVDAFAASRRVVSAEKRREKFAGDSSSAKLRRNIEKYEERNKERGIQRNMEV
jgi:hypothetical protein